MDLDLTNASNEGTAVCGNPLSIQATKAMEMLAKMISAGALTLLLTGSALAYIPQPQQGTHNVYAGH